MRRAYRENGIIKNVDVKDVDLRILDEKHLTTYQILVGALTLTQMATIMFQSFGYLKCIRSEHWTTLMNFFASGTEEE